MHDLRDGDALLRVLRDEVIPLYYDRDRDGLPREWIARMKRAIRTLGWRFSADRMVMDYVLNVNPRGRRHEQRRQPVLEQSFRLEDDENAQTEDQAHSCKQPIEKCDRRGDRWPGPVVS